MGSVCSKLARGSADGIVYQVGPACAGKTPLMKILASAIAHYHTELEEDAQAGVMIPREMDFFRGEFDCNRSGPRSNLEQL